MSWKDYICRTPVIVACYVFGVIFILIKTLLFGNSWMSSKFAEEGASLRSAWSSSIENGLLNATEPGIAARDAVWQDVDGLTYVYSAYYEDRLRWLKTIRIIGATKNRREVFRCKFWYSNRKFSETSKARVKIFQGHKNKFEFSSCFILCPFKSEEIPESVSVITNQKRLTNNLFVINTNTTPPDTMDNKAKRIGICVKPLYNNYNDSVQLVEFMELNQILGVDHVTFYKSSISITMECILKNYIDEGRATMVTAMPWKSRPEGRIRNENQLAALNDCMYRNMHNFSYLAFLDVDEFIMPGHNDKIHQLIKTLDVYAGEMPYGIGSYSFRNGFFYLEWADDPNTMKSLDVYEKSLATLLKSTRRSYLHPHGTLSKIIVKPTKVQEVSHQRVAEFMKGFVRLAALEDEAILNHYRRCEYRGSLCTGEPSRTDRTAFRYKYRLVAAVKQRWKKLQERCGMEDIQEARSELFKTTKNRGV